MIDVGTITIQIMTYKELKSEEIIKSDYNSN